MRAGWGWLLLLPFLVGFDGREAQRALEAALHNLHGADMLAAVEMEMREPDGTATWISFAYSRKRTEQETKTLVYVTEEGRPVSGALLLQRRGARDRIFVSEGRYGQVRPLSAGDHTWPLYGSDYIYEDFRAHDPDEYSIEVLGGDTIADEPCRVLRLRPREGPYASLVVWISTRRPVVVRTDYFDAQGLWKRRTINLERLRRDFDWWVALEDEMVDLRSGRRTIRRVRNLLIDVEVPDEIFSVSQLARGRAPSF